MSELAPHHGEKWQVPVEGTPLERLKKTREELVARFLSGREAQFLSRHAGAFDEYFRSSYEESAVGPRMGIDKNPYVFIALGGYGRMEQCIHSDVDVLVLFKKKVPAAAKELVRELFYPLWDLGLEVGYSTRSLRECCSMAADDFEILTALLDCRFVCGMSHLFSELTEQLHEKVIRKQRRAFTQWLAQWTAERHARFGDSSYLLEPNLKDGQGGLRDYHTTLWLAHSVYNLREPREMVYADLLTHQEYEELQQALSFIWEVRNWLHHLTGRKADQLYFEHQIKVAEALKYQKVNGQEPVERFLGELHGHMELLKRQNLMLLQRVAPVRQGLRLVKPRKRVTVAGLEIENDKLKFETPEIILQKPHLLIKIFEQSSRLALPISTSAKRLVHEFSYLVDDEFRSDRTVVQAMQRIVSDPPRTFNVMDEMYFCGLMTELFPELKDIVNRVQYDIYHVFPVDKHSLRALENVKKFAREERDGEHDLFQDIYRELKRPDLLLWATFFHDIGKGMVGKDHAVAGEELVRTIFTRMEFPPNDVDTIAFLVRHHLLLVHTAQKRDINDEMEVVQCARTAHDTELLKMIYLLTVADSMATGPKAWNDWSDVLYRDLFFKARRILARGELASPAASESVKRKREAVFASHSTMSEKELEAVFNSFSPRYVLYTPEKDITAHIELYRKLLDNPFVWDVQMHSKRKYRIATICAKDRPGLFSKMAGVFTLNNLDIMNAQIYTWRNQVAMDIFTLKAPPDETREDETWKRAAENLKDALDGSLDLSVALAKKFEGPYNAGHRLRLKPPKVVVDNNSSAFSTIVEVYTYDYPGLLYRITDALFRCKLDVKVAKIGTKVDQVLDVFYVRDLEGQKVDDPKQVEAIQKALEPVTQFPSEDE